MKISYRIEKSDFIAAQLLHRSKGGSWKDRAPRLLFIGFLSLIFFLPPVMDMVERRRVNSLDLRYLFFLSLAYVVIGWIILPFLRKRDYVRDYVRNPRIQEPITVEISEGGVYQEGKDYTATMKWQIFTHYLEDDDLFLLYESAPHLRILPKRAFAPGEAEQFRELLKSKLPPK
jgi:hypothetical protein